MTIRDADPAERFHALDNLRAIMMWLGIVLHVGMNYSLARTAVPVHDDTHSVVADLLMAFIHAFRMPVFFVVAGFLGAMLLAKRGPRAFLVHRMKRLALPFIVFWPFLWLATGLAMLAFLNRMAFGRWGLDEGALPPNVPRGATMHLWFLWVLAWFCLAAALLARLPRAPFATTGRWLARIGGAWWGFALLGLPLVVAGEGYPMGLLIAKGVFLLPWNEWLHNAVFFTFGFALWAHRDTLLPHYEQFWVRYGVAGLGIFLVFLVLAGKVTREPGSVPWFVTSFCYNALAWLWGFTWLGLAQKFLARRNALLAYLADSAYWVYLIHLPIAIGIAAVLYREPLPALAKMLVGIVVTSVLCLGSYRLFVRHTWIGVLLNGKRHPRPTTPGPTAPSPA